MANVRKNLGPISMAVLLHVALFGSMLVAFDFARPTPITPMAIQATLVVEDSAEALPPPAAPIQEPEPAPEPDPEIEEPPPEPDNSEELRRQAEEEKRVQDALIEKERLAKIRQQEEAEKKRKQREEEEERKKREEADKEKKRIAAEKKREDDIKRQREENERTRRELEAEQRQAEVDAEERRFATRNSAEMTAYQFAIAQRIRRNWSVPASAGPETRCTVRVQQLPGGDIVGVNIMTCNGDEAVKRSVEAAIRRSSPLPEPANPELFDRHLTLHLTLERED